MHKSTDRILTTHAGSADGAAQAVPLTEFDAQAEPVVCADHPSANVLGVAETAEGHGFKLDRAGTPH